jgi:fibronectin-binding autotransporter adhesin
MRVNRSAGVPLTLLVALAFALPVAAQTWTGATSGNWATVSNWSAPPLIGADTQLAFGGTTHADMANNVIIQFVLNRMTFDAGGPAYTLTGSPLFFRTSSGNVSPSVVMNSDGALTIGTGIDVLNGLTINGTGAGTVTLSGAITNSGGLTYAGAGTLALGSGSNSYGGGTVVDSGTLLLGNGTALPTGRNVTVAPGATFNTGGLSNTTARAIGTLTLNGGTFRVSSGGGDYYLNQLVMTGGTVDFTGTSNFGLHFPNSAAVTINPGTSTWVGDGTSRILNNSVNPLTISLHGTLNAGIILSADGSNPNFVMTNGAIRLSNVGNTANITATSSANILSNDLSTDVGFGAFGTLGKGSVTLSLGGLIYDGPTANSSKPLTLGNYSLIGVQNDVNLKMAGVISEPVPDRCKCLAPETSPI